MYTPIGETDFYDAIFRPAYYPPPVSPYDASPPPEPSAHEVAVLCMALAMGTLLDLDQQPFNSAANKWYQLGRAALSIDSVLDEPTIAATQALVSTVVPPVSATLTGRAAHHVPLHVLG